MKLWIGIAWNWFCGTGVAHRKSIVLYLNTAYKIWFTEEVCPQVHTNSNQMLEPNIMKKSMQEKVKELKDATSVTINNSNILLPTTGTVILFGLSCFRLYIFVLWLFNGHNLWCCQLPAMALFLQSAKFPCKQLMHKQSTSLDKSSNFFLLFLTEWNLIVPVTLSISGSLHNCKSFLSTWMKDYAVCNDSSWCSWLNNVSDTCCKDSASVTAIAGSEPVSDFLWM